MKITKRDGTKQDVRLSKIQERLRKLKTIEGVEKLSIDTTPIAIKVVEGLYDGVTTSELDTLAAETAVSLGTTHPEYQAIASRIEISRLHKETEFTDIETSLGKDINSFSSRMNYLFRQFKLSTDFIDFIDENEDRVNKEIDYSRDYLIDYFGIQTLKRSYLLKNENEEIVERPQDMWMRTALQVHLGDIDRAIETYHLMSQKYFTHATPTLFNSGTKRPQLSSCFLLDIQEDSIEGIYKTLTDCAKISQHAGGIGLSVSKIRSKGSHIKGTGGTSNGIVPMLRNYNETARYVDQGGGKRKGSFAIYLEPWHPDIFDFLDLKKNHGKEELRARDLFYALWIPDLFMRRVESDDFWTLVDPNSQIEGIRGSELQNRTGEDFEKLYSLFEISGAGQRKVRARDLWYKILESQIETGTPYMLYKDSANTKSNQQNLGTIKSSNLCTEIIEYTDEKESAVCNLASISLSIFVSNSSFDYDKLYDVSRIVTRNLDNVIDVNYYPTKETEQSNKRHRPIGIGVQGLADVFHKLKIAFDSHEAKVINRRIFETIYKGAIDESIELAKTKGQYETYEGSPASKGQLQFHLWGVKEGELFHDWSSTLSDLSKFGLRNSLLLAPMPTASTSQILGNNECFEPFTSNIYTRRVLSGEFVVVNKYLVDELIELGLWNEVLKQLIVAQNGSVQNIPIIPKELKDRYKTVWEMSMKDIIDMAADRGKFICQSQSMNMFVADPTFESLTSMHFYGWKKGLKTGMYYLRTKPAAQAQKFTVEVETDPVEPVVCNIDDPDCLSCGS